MFNCDFKDKIRPKQQALSTAAIKIGLLVCGDKRNVSMKYNSLFEICESHHDRCSGHYISGRGPAWYNFPFKIREDCSLWFGYLPLSSMNRSSAIPTANNSQLLGTLPWNWRFVSNADEETKFAVSLVKTL